MTTMATAIKFRAEKKFDEALAILSSLLSAAPDDPLLHYQYAWTLDAAGKESEAIPYYEACISNGLAGDDRRSAFLGLGSTYRCLGQYARSLAVFDKGLTEFPDDRPIKVFRALTLYNLGKHADSLGALLVQLVETTGDEAIRDYKRALLFYSERLDETFT